MTGNRVKPELVEALSGFAEQYWEDVLDEAKVAFAQPKPKPADKDYWKALSFHHQAKQRLLATLKMMAQARSGAIHPTGQNTETERTAAADWLAKARKELGTSED